MATSTRHVCSKLLALGAIITAVGWLGCATSGDDPITDDAPATPSPSTKTTPGSDEPRPEFEAGFEDAPPNTDPTPDGGSGTCADPGDPGSSENTAKALPNTTDAQNDAITVSGVLNGPVDVDFYKLSITDSLTHNVEAATQVKTAGAEMCVFVKCPTGAAEVTCNGGGTPKKSDLGTDGCCATGPSSATPIWNCSGINDSATLYFRITQTANKCLPYSFSYAF
jgi:hypothetical protein